MPSSWASSDLVGQPLAGEGLLACLREAPFNVEDKPNISCSEDLSVRVLGRGIRRLAIFGPFSSGLIGLITKISFVSFAEKNCRGRWICRRRSWEGNNQSNTSCGRRQTLKPLHVGYVCQPCVRCCLEVTDGSVAHGRTRV